MQASVEIADRFISGLTAKCHSLLHFPFIGPARPHIGDRMRVVFYRKYAVYYRPDDSEVVIVRVLHGARDVPAIAERGGFEVD